MGLIQKLTLAALAVAILQATAATLQIVMAVRGGRR